MTVPRRALDWARNRVGLDHDDVNGGAGDRRARPAGRAGDDHFRAIVNVTIALTTGVFVVESMRTAETIPGSLKSDVALLTASAVGRRLKMTVAGLLVAGVTRAVNAPPPPPPPPPAESQPHGRGRTPPVTIRSRDPGDMYLSHRLRS